MTPPSCMYCELYQNAGEGASNTLSEFILVFHSPKTLNLHEMQKSNNSNNDSKDNLYA